MEISSRSSYCQLHGEETMKASDDQTLGKAGAVLHGAIGGAHGAGAMSVLRLAMYRAGVIDKMVPQVTQEWMRDRTGVKRSGGNKTSHHVVDQLLQLGYGTALGAAC